MDNRRVAKVYRDKTQRVRKLPLARPAGLLSKVKRYFSTGRLPSRIASFSGRSESPQEDLKQEELQPNRDFSFVIPEALASANSTTIVSGTEDSNRILSSFFQAKGDAPLSQVEYEGVISLLDRSKASITLPLPESTPEGTPRVKSRANGGENDTTCGNYSQKIFRNTSGYDIRNISTSSLAASDYKPAYHTFSEASRGSIPIKRIYSLSNTSAYKKRIKVPEFFARRSKRTVSAAPDVPVTDSVEDTSASNQSFQPKSKTANSLLSILDGNTPVDESAETVSESGKKALHNPYARPKRFTPLQKDPIFETSASATKAEDISKTLAYNKAEEIEISGQTEKSEEIKIPQGIDSLFGNPGKASDAISPSKMSVSKVTNEDEKNVSTKDSLISKPQKNSFGLPESSLNGTPGPFDLGKNGPLPTENDETSTKKPLESVIGGPNTNPAFSFGAKPTESSKPALNLFSASTEPKPVSSFGSESSKTIPAASGFTFGSSVGSTQTPNENTIKIADPKPVFSFSSKTDAMPKPAFTFGSKEVRDKAAFSFGAKSSAEMPLSVEQTSAPKPTFTFGATNTQGSHSKDTNKAEDKDVETIEVGSGSDDDGNNTPKPTTGSKANTNSSLFGSKPAFNIGAAKDADKADGKPAFNFGVKENEENNPNKSAFSFGSGTPQQSPKLDFGIGSKPADTEKPAFIFGISQPQTSSASTFKFTSKPSENKEDTPSFSFGNTPQASSFNFASQSEKSKSVEKPSFNFEAKPSVAADSETKTLEAASDKEEPLKDKSTSLFGAGPKTAETKPSPAFTFGSNTSTEKPAAEKPAFSYGDKVSESMQKSKTPAITFGDINNEKPGFSFGSQVSQSPTLPIFSFGSKSTESKSVESKSAEPKPAFSFGSKSTEEKTNVTPAPSLDSQASKTPGSEKTASTFEVLKHSDQPSVPKPLFKFASKPVEQGKSSSPSEKPSEAQPAFGFGKSTSENKLAFTFGSKPATNKDSTDNPSFTFGSKPSVEGDKTENSVASNTSFSFGDKPAFNFTAKSTENDTDTKTSKPAFIFGTKPTEPNTAEIKPASSSVFGSNAVGSNPFTFGSSTNKESTNGSGGFSFGSEPNANKMDPHPKKSENNTNGKNEQKPVFQFGATTTTNSTPFSFGAEPAADAKPAFTFGSSSTKSETQSASNGSETQNGNGLNGTDANESSLENVFVFPDAPLIDAEVNEEEVKKYESLFQF